MVITLAMLFVMQENVVIFSMNYSLGIIFVINGLVKLEKAKKCLNKSQRLRWVLLVQALLSIILGVVALVATNRVMESYVFVVGSLMIIKGVCEITFKTIEL
jgi:uncharacterized membrane protein HdeD (DUF308 family)